MTLDEQIPIWIDCDTGEDDSLAILLAAFCPKFKVIGISTVFGNAPLEKTTHNTLYILQALGMKQGDIKVYPGESKPLEKEPHYAADMHGESGLGGVNVPKDLEIAAETHISYMTALEEAIDSHNGNLCIVATGSLTNIYKVMEKDPTLASKIRYISIMGGAMERGNVTKFSEFNFFSDPKAAAKIVANKILAPKIILAPLDLTHKVRATELIRNNIRIASDPAKSSDVRKLYESIIDYYFKAYKKKYNDDLGPPVHDPVAIFILAALVDESNTSVDYGFKYNRSHLKIIENGERQGQMICMDDDILLKSNEGSFIGQEINVSLFWSWVMNAIEQAEKNAL